jgi:hypothetical protein
MSQTKRIINGVIGAIVGLLMAGALHGLDEPITRAALCGTILWALFSAIAAYTLGVL